MPWELYEGLLHSCLANCEGQHYNTYKTTNHRRAFKCLFFLMEARGSMPAQSATSAGLRRSLITGCIWDRRDPRKCWGRGTGMHPDTVFQSRVLSLLCVLSFLFRHSIIS